MRIVIQAAGALGLLIGWFLIDNNEVVCVSRKRIVDEISGRGLEVKFSGNSKVKKLNVVDSIGKVPFEPELVVLACKSYDSDENLAKIKSHWPVVNLLTIQNGVYTEYKALEMFNKKQLYPASVMIGSKFIGSNTLEQFFDYGMKLGGFGGDALDEIVEVLTNAGIKVEKSDNIMRDKWHKFMFYCSSATVNALTATTDLSYEHTRWIVGQSLEEIVQVGEHMGLDFDVKQLADEVFEFAMGFKPKVWNASVGVDLRRGKRTEIDYLNGYVVKLAKRFGKSVPVNETLYRLVKTLENTKLFADFK